MHRQLSNADLTRNTVVVAEGEKVWLPLRCGITGSGCWAENLPKYSWFLRGLSDKKSHLKHHWFMAIYRNCHPQWNIWTDYKNKHQCCHGSCRHGSCHDPWSTVERVQQSVVLSPWLETRCLCLTDFHSTLGNLKANLCQWNFPCTKGCALLI